VIKMVQAQTNDLHSFDEHTFFKLAEQTHYNVYGYESSQAATNSDNANKHRQHEGRQCQWNSTVWQITKSKDYNRTGWVSQRIGKFARIQATAKGRNSV